MVYDRCIPNVDTLALAGSPVNWLDAAFYTMDVVSEMIATIRGTGMDSELIPLFALLLLAGGVIFWLFLAGAAVVGLCRGVRRVSWWIQDMWGLITKHYSGGEIPHVES